LLLAGCNSKPSSTEEEDEVRELKTKVFKFTISEPHAQGSIICEFPVGGDDELCDSIYDYLLTTMVDQQSYEEEVPDFHGKGQDFVNFWGNKINADLIVGWERFTEEFGDDSIDELSENAKYSVVENNDHYLTYIFDYDCFYGGDGFVKKVGTTFIKEDACRLTNDFLFKDASSPKLLQLVRNTLKEGASRGAYADDETIDNIQKLPENPFYITPEGLAFNYNPYEIDVFWVGGVIPFDKVKKLLTDEALELIEE
jgi:hypothetical protein